MVPVNSRTFSSANMVSEKLSELQETVILRFVREFSSS